jgi:hypothetical protein
VRAYLSECLELFDNNKFFSCDENFKYLWLAFRNREENQRKGIIRILSPEFRLPLKKDDRGSPISKQPQRYPSDSFDEEDLGYYLDKEGLIKSSRIYYEWEEHFFRTENGNIKTVLFEKKAQVTDILSTDSIRISNSSELSDTNKIHQAFEPVKKSTEVLAMGTSISLKVSAKLNMY